MANMPITESEVGKAKKLAARKIGATRGDIASALNVTPARAGKILERVPGVKIKSAGADFGRAYRTLVYTVG